MRRHILLLITLALTGCSSEPPAPGEKSASEVVAIRLPDGAFPRFLTVAGDGSVWCGESSGEAIAHITREGDVSHVRIPGTSNSPADVVQATDGVIWFSGFQLIGRIDADGELSGWRTGPDGGPNIGLPNSLTLGPDNAMWYTNKTEQPTITRISPTGEFTHFHLPEESATSALGDIAGAPPAPCGSPKRTI